MAMEYRGNVIVLDDGTEQTADMVERVRGIFPNVLRLAAAPNAPGVISVDPKQLTVKTLVRAMEEHQAYWALIGKNRDPVVVIADYLSVARHALANGFPAFVLVATEPGKRYQRIAIVADVGSPVTTGSLALSGVGLACHIGASLDVLLLGADPDNPPQTWHDVEQMFDIRIGAEYFDQALIRAREVGLRVNWVPVRDSGSRDKAVLDAVREGGYDLVLDDVRAIDVGPRIGRLHRVEKQLVGGSHTDTAYRLLRDAPCDVGIVVDAVTMNIVPSSAVRVGAVAALSIGVVGVASQPFIAQSTSDAAAMVATAEAPLDPAAQAVADAQAQAQAPEAEQAAAPPIVGIPAPSPAELPAEVSGEEYDGYQSTYAEEQAVFAAQQAELAALQQQQAAADQAVTLAQSDLALERSDVASARATVDSADAALDYAQRGKDSLTEAEEARALGSRNAAQRDLQRQQSDVKQAEEALQEARAQAAASAEAVAAKQVVVDAEAGNMAAWDAFIGEADARVDKVVAPVAGYPISTGYGVAGPYWASGYHTGIDYAAPAGTAIVAAANGTVTSAGWNGPYGNRVTIQHEDGTSTTYSHLSAINVSVGQAVRGGDQIGAVGSTGNSTGPHLHFELLDAGGGFTNPQSWLAANGVG